MSYRMSVRRRVGSIAPIDFNEHAARFVTICGQVYGGVKIELVRDRFVPVGWGRLFYKGDYDREPWMDGMKVDNNVLANGTFGEVFRSAMSIQLNVRAADEGDDFRPSFAQIQWLAQRPRLLSLYAQDASDKQLPSLERTLAAQMFNDRSAWERLKFSLREG